MRISSRNARFLLLTSLGLAVSAAVPTSAQLSPLGARLLEQCAGADSCDTNDAFGDAVATGDFDNDGFEDLAVGVPGEDIGDGDAASGAVHIFYGSPSGLLPANGTVFHQGTEGIGDTADPGDHFGAALAAADFNGDGFDDLAIGAPDEDVGALEDIGAVWVLFGSASGLTATGSLLFGQAAISDTESAETGDRFGAALAAGRINTGSRADLVIGVPGEDGIPGIENDSGKIHVLYNDGSTPLAREEDWTQSEVECDENDENENGDGFGSALAVADFDDDGFADVVVGSPFEDCNGFVKPCDNNTDVGRVHVFTSSSSGLTLAGVECFGADNGLIPSPESQNDRLGGAVAGGDFNGDGVNDLAIGATGESFAPAQEGGVVEMILGQEGAEFSTGAQYSQNDVDPDQAESFDHFGASLAVGNFDGDAFADLAVGVPDDDVSGNANAGEIAVLYGSVNGLEGVGQGAFHSNLPPEMPDSPNASDFFGAALAAGDFDGSGVDDLAIGIPGEDLGAANAAGMVNVLYGLDRATGAFGTVQFDDGTVSVAEDSFTAVVARRTNAVIAGSVDHFRFGGTATPGVDFAYSPGTFSWDAADETLEFAIVNPVDDTLDEPTQTVIIDLANPSAALALGTPRRIVVSILDNDVAGTLQFQSASLSVPETLAARLVIVTRTGGDASGVTILYDTNDGTATAGEDYTTASGQLSFDFEQTGDSFGVPILDDTADEPNETIELRIFSPQGGGILGTPSTAILTILDDDPDGQIFRDGFETGDVSLWDTTSP